MSLNVVIPDTFNGPLGLLHSLIVRDEIDIYDIPIAGLTASYCAEIEKMAVIDIDEGTEFLDLASRLQDIKLRMLLPPEERPEEEEEDGEIDDPRSSLVESLLEYRRFKDAARLLGELAEEQERRYPRVSPKMRFHFVDPDEDADADGGIGLLMAMQSMLDRLSAPEVIESREIPIATRIEQIREVLSKRETSRFSLLLSTNPARGEIVAFFIAVLELIRRGELRARQTDNFSDIVLERREPERREAGAAGGRRAARPLRMTACFPSARRLFPPEREEKPAGEKHAPFPCAFSGFGAGHSKSMKQAARPFPAAGR